MDKLIPRIQKIAKRITETEQKRKKLASFIQELNAHHNLIIDVEQKPVNETIIGVDGGLMKKSFHGIDFLLVRAAAVHFAYDDSKVKKVDYYPSKYPTPIPEFSDHYSEQEWNYFCSMKRQLTEITTATEAIKTFTPDLILLHGMLIPHVADRPAKSSPLHRYYQDLLEAYKTLYTTAQDTKTMLGSVVEDTRSVSFCNVIISDIFPQVQHSSIPELITLLRRTRDTNLLFLTLEQNQRTQTLKGKADEHPILKDLGEIGTQLNSFYIKPVKWDRPLRIEFFAPTANPDSLASLISSIASHHSGYGLPAPIIEADNVAKLSENEMDTVLHQLFSYTGHYLPSLFTLRRENRPF